MTDNRLVSALRKAAILVATLEPADADALLDQMPSEQAARVRRAVMELGDIPLAEQNAVIQEFMGRERFSMAAEDGGVELDDELARRISADARSTTASAPGESEPAGRQNIHRGGSADEPEPHRRAFQFLQDAAPEAVARFLTREHPQTTAVVLAHLPPDRAAELLTRLEPRLQAEVLSRIAHLSTTQPDILQTLEESLYAQLADQIRPRPRSAGLAAVESILKAVDVSGRNELLDQVGRVDTRLAEALGSQRSGGSPVPLQGDSSGAASKKTTDVPASPRLSETRMAPPRPSAASTPPFDFEDLQQLSGKDLARVLEAAGPQLMFLALAGAPRAVVDHLLATVPSRYARELQRRMERLGPTRLQDMAIAQQRVARLAAELIAAGLVRPIAPKRFAAAV